MENHLGRVHHSTDPHRSLEHDRRARSFTLEKPEFGAQFICPEEAVLYWQYREVNQKRNTFVDDLLVQEVMLKW